MFYSLILISSVVQQYANRHYIAYIATVCKPESRDWSYPGNSTC